MYKQTGLGAFLQRATPLVAPEPPPPPPPPPLPKPTTARSKQILGAPPPTSASVPLSLNPQQKSAAEHAGGLLCVEAGPGSGKTRVIAARVEHLCVAANVPAHRILVLTFSNKAAGELRARVGARARGAMVMTFHAFCAWLLRTSGGAIGVRPDFKLVDAAMQRDVLREVLRGESEGADEAARGKRRVDEPHPHAEDEADEDDERGGSSRRSDGLLEAILSCKRERAAERAAASESASAASSASAPTDSAAAAADDRVRSLAGRDDADESERVRVLTERYESLLASRGALDFDDLLWRGLQLLGSAEEGGRMRGRFLHVLVDEFQDTSSVQCALVRSLCDTHANATLVGDPNQCIYAWRQAERSNLAQLEQSWPRGGVTRLPLTQSYRSTKRVLRVACTILATPIALAAEETVPADPYEPSPPELWTRNACGAPIGVHVYADAQAEAAGVAHHLAALLAASTATAEEPSRGAQLGATFGGLLGGKRVTGSEIAILARTGRQLAGVREALARHGVGAASQDGTRLSERKEVKAILSQLQLLLDPSDRSAFERLLKAAKGIGDATVSQILADAAAPHAAAGEAHLMEALLQFARHNGIGVSRDAHAGGAAQRRKPPSRAVTAAAHALCHAHEELSRMLDGGCGADALVREAARRSEAWLAPTSKPSSTKSAPLAAPSQPPPLPPLQPPRITGFVSAAAAASIATAATATAAADVAAASGQTSVTADDDPLDELLRLATNYTLSRPHGDDSVAEVTEADREASGRCGESSSRYALRSFIHSVGLGGGEGGEARGGNKVTLCTLHAAKGLEWRLVWIVGCEDGAIPHSRGVREAYASGGAAAAATVLREERRLLYVGATRAKECLIFSRALSRAGEPTRPCPFLRALSPVGTRSAGQLAGEHVATDEAGECEASVFVPPSLAAEYESTCEHVSAAEAEQMASVTARRWLSALDGRLSDAKSGRHAAHEAAFLASFYGADFAERYSAVDGLATDGGYSEEEEEPVAVASRPPPKPSSSYTNAAPLATGGRACSSGHAVSNLDCDQSDAGGAGGSGVLRGGFIGGLGPRGRGGGLGGGRLLGGRGRGVLQGGRGLLGGGGLLANRAASAGSSGFVAAASATEIEPTRATCVDTSRTNGNALNRAFKRPRPSGV